MYRRQNHQINRLCNLRTTMAPEMNLEKRLRCHFPTWTFDHQEQPFPLFSTSQKV